MSEPVWMLEELDEGVYETGTPRDVSESNAEDHLEHLKRIKYELERDLQHVAQQQEKIDRFAKRSRDRAQKKIDYHEACLMRFLEARGETSKTLINGSLRTRTGRMSVEITDESLVPKEFYKTPDPKVSKVLISKHIKTTGEIPDGVDWVRGEDSFTVELSETPQLTPSQQKEIEDGDLPF